MPTAVNDDLCPDDWEQALITGGGGQGALVYGGPDALRVTVSHERLFLPVDEPLDPPDTGAILRRLRELCLADQYQAAADAVVEQAERQDQRYARLREIDPLIGAATITFIPHQPAGPGWRRSVDFDTGEVVQGTPTLTQRVVASRVEGVVRVELSGTVRGRLQLGPIDGAPPAPIALSHGATAGGLWLRALFPRRWPGAVAGYVTTVRVSASGARVHGYALELDTDRATLVIRTRVSESPARSRPRAPAHTHRELMRRCRVSLPDGTGRLFDAGRYAIISATGDRPPTLQGVWSGTYHPPWRSGYTMDGNLPAALAGLGPTGTPELLLPALNLLDSFRDDFRTNAQRLYRAPGFVLPPHLSTHGRHNHFGPRWCLTFWTAGAAWAGRLYYDYWRYTGDREFLAQRAFPFLAEAMRFYQAFCPDGRIVPSYSPENSPAGPDGPQATINATHEVAAIRDLGRCLHAAARVLDAPIEPGWQELLDRLPPYQIGPDGSLAEWLWPGLGDHHGHRHASQLYGLWYEPDPLLVGDRALRAAAATTIRHRLRWWADHGDEMAFGLVQLGLAAAALGQAEDAYQALTWLRRYWRANLVPTHNLDAIFNVDIAGGLPALVVAMLVAGGDERVDLLPALPAAWPEGSLDGALLRGGVRVDHLTWSRHEITVVLTCANPRPLTVTVGGQRPRHVPAGTTETRLSWHNAR